MKRKHYVIIIVILCCTAPLLLLNVTKRNVTDNPIFDNGIKESELVSLRKESNQDREDGVFGNNTPYPEELAMTLRDHDSKKKKEELIQSYYAHHNGVDAMMTFHVTDSEGQNVLNASVHATFIVNDKKTTVCGGKTNEKGIFVAQGKAAYEVNYAVEKDGYYRTCVTYSFSKLRGDYYLDGKWQPWNPTVEVTLKEKRNPIPMYHKDTEIILPKTNEVFGFDFQMGDLVEPYGRGKITDIRLTYVFLTPSAEGDEYFAHIAFDSASENGGTLLMESDLHSQYKSLYEAPMGKYEPRFEMYKRFTRQGVLEKKELTINDYLVFRSRVETGNGQIKSAHYGRIHEITYGGTSKNPDGGFVKMRYYFNPTPNDRNIEYNPNENLFDKKKNRGMRP